MFVIRHLQGAGMFVMRHLITRRWYVCDESFNYRELVCL